MGERQRERECSGEEARGSGKNGRAYLKEAVKMRQQSHGNGEGVATKRRRKSGDGHGGRGMPGWMVRAETTLAYVGSTRTKWNPNYHDKTESEKQGGYSPQCCRRARFAVPLQSVAAAPQHPAMAAQRSRTLGSPGDLHIPELLNGF